MHAAVEGLLTADVAREIARAYGDRPIYPEHILLDAPDRPSLLGGRRFPGWPGPVLVLADESQGACSYGVPLDGDQVLVGGVHRRTVPYAASVREFLAARRWDYQCVSSELCAAAQTAELDQASLDFLQAHCRPSVVTNGWPGIRQYRYERHDVRVLLWADNGCCEWLVSAATEASLVAFIGALRQVPALRTARWADSA